MVSSQLVLIVVAAMIAGVVLFRLYTVLGRRTGNERDPQERLTSRWGRPTGNLTQLPPQRPATADMAGPKPFNETERGLLDIKLADRSFEAERFLAGAKKAHELIVTAYAEGDRGALRPLLSDEVYAAFDRAIKERDQRREQIKFTVVGYKDAKITQACVKARTAEVTVTFQVQIISSTTNADGTLVDGDPTAVRDITDIWTFARDTESRDPNWTLIATSGVI